MDRLQKKCLIGTASAHLLLVLVVIFGAAFLPARKPADDSQILTIIPTTLTDQPFNSGVPKPTTPPPTPRPPTTPPPQPQPQPTPPPPQPEPKPVVHEPDPVKTPDLTPGDLTPVKPKQLKKKVTAEKPDDLFAHKVTHRVVKPVEDHSAEDEREAKAEARARAKAWARAMNQIENHVTSATEVQMSGTSSVSYANYATAVRSIYDHAWTSPDGVANDVADVEVKVVVARDGNVVSARITTPSGDAAMDASVRQAIESVSTLPPFPDGASEDTKTFYISFNLKSKRLNG